LTQVNAVARQKLQYESVMRIGSCPAQQSASEAPSPDGDPLNHFFWSMHMLKKIHSMARQRGLTTVEYAVAGAVITAAVIAAFVALGGKIGPIIQAISDAL